MITVGENIKFFFSFLNASALNGTCISSWTVLVLRATATTATAAATMAAWVEMILYSFILVKISYRIQRCTFERIRATEKSKCIRSNDVDHLQNRMINIFERYFWASDREQERERDKSRFLHCYSCPWKSVMLFTAPVNLNEKKRKLNKLNDIQATIEKRQPRSIALLYGNAHFLMCLCLLIINGAQYRESRWQHAYVPFAFIRSFLTYWFFFSSRDWPDIFFMHCTLSFVFAQFELRFLTCLWLAGRLAGCHI